MYIAFDKLTQNVVSFTSQEYIYLSDFFFDFSRSGRRLLSKQYIFLALLFILPTRHLRHILSLYVHIYVLRPYLAIKLPPFIDADVVFGVFTGGLHEFKNQDLWEADQLGELSVSTSRVD